MLGVFLEYMNVMVSNLEVIVWWLKDWFGWEIRWKGDVLNGGMIYYIGNEISYVVVYFLFW